MLKNIHRVLSMVTPRQRVWIVSLLVVSTTVTTFIPSDGPIDKVISLFDNFTYDDSEMKTQLKLQRQRLKDLILINDSLNNQLLSQSRECTQELINQNENFKNRLFQIQTVFEEHEKEEINTLNTRPKSYRVTVKQKDKVNLKYDTIVRESYEERSLVLEQSSASSEQSSSVKRKPWWKRPTKSEDEELLMSSPPVIESPTTRVRVLVKRDTILEPKYTTQQEVEYDTMVIHNENDRNQTEPSLKKLKNLIETNVNRKDKIK